MLYIIIYIYYIFWDGLNGLSTRKELVWGIKVPWGVAWIAFRMFLTVLYYYGSNWLMCYTRTFWFSCKPRTRCRSFMRSMQLGHNSSSISVPLPFQKLQRHWGISKWCPFQRGLPLRKFLKPRLQIVQPFTIFHQKPFDPCNVTLSWNTTKLY